MISPRVTTQLEIDAALLELGIKPTGKYTTDGTQQLYENGEKKGFILPSSNQGYSYYSVDDILAHVKKMSSSLNVVDTRHFVAKPNLKLAKSDE